MKVRIFTLGIEGQGADMALLVVVKCERVEAAERVAVPVAEDEV